MLFRSHGGDDVGGGDRQGQPEDEQDECCEEQGKIEVAAGDVDDDARKLQPDAGEIDDPDDNAGAGAGGGYAQDLPAAGGESLDQFSGIEG